MRKFIDQIFHVVECVRARAPWKFIDAPLRGRGRRLRTTAIKIKTLSSYSNFGLGQFFQSSARPH